MGVFDGLGLAKPGASPAHVAERDQREPAIERVLGAPRLAPCVALPFERLERLSGLGVPAVAELRFAVRERTPAPQSAAREDAASDQERGEEPARPADQEPSARRRTERERNARKTRPSDGHETRWAHEIDLPGGDTTPSSATQPSCEAPAEIR